MTLLLLSFTADIVPATDVSFKVSMSPWTNYTFRYVTLKYKLKSITQ